MKILDIRVEWMVGWGNNPYFEILVDRVPKLEEYRFEQHGDIHIAELDGAVCYFACGYPNQSGGYGGREFDIIMADGSPRTLLGPWSSGSHHINTFYKPVVDLSWTDDPVVFKRGYTFSAGHVTYEMFQRAFAELVQSPIYLVKSWVNQDEVEEAHLHKNHGGFCITASLDPKKLVKPTGPEARNRYSVIGVPE